MGSQAKRHIGRARPKLRPPKPPGQREPLGTRALPVAPQPPPVFVDASGRRRRVLHVAALLVVLATVAGAIVLLVGVYAQPVDPAPLEVCPAAPTNPAARTNPAATTNPAARTNPAAASNPTVSVKRAGATVPVGGGSCARR